MTHTSIILSILMFLLSASSFAQVGDMPKEEVVMHDVSLVEAPAMNLPYATIPDAPADYTSGNMLSRMIDGLGFRYHWVSEGLRAEDLAYRPSEDARSCRETLEHIYGLSDVVLNGVKNAPNVRPVDFSVFSFQELRVMTLNNLKEASDLARGMTAEQVSKLTIIFERNGKQSSSTFWHMLNGPLADAIYHTGQVVSFRRSSGNPQRPGVNVFRGTVKK